MSSALEGTYVNDNIGATLVISQADDLHGDIKSASLTYDGHTYGAAGHYHFKGNNGETTVIVLNALDDGTGYISLAMTANSRDFKMLRSFGGKVTFDAAAIGLGGEFVRH